MNKYPFPRLDEDIHLKKRVTGGCVVYGVRKNGEEIKQRYWLQMSTEMCYIIVGRTKIFGLLIKFVCVRIFSVTAILKHAACCFRTI